MFNIKIITEEELDHRKEFLPAIDENGAFIVLCEGLRIFEVDQLGNVLVNEKHIIDCGLTLRT